MELLDYLAHRWKLWVSLLSLGVIALVLIGDVSRGGGYQAQAQMLVRPNASQTTTYASNPDRYVETEMALLLAPFNLERQAEDIEMSAGDLKQALSYTHQPDSEIVVLRVAADSAEKAINGVNAVARTYIEDAASSSRPGEGRTTALNNQIDSTQQRLNRVNRRIQRAVTQFRNNNPDAGTPSASTVAPQAAIQQSLLSSRLQQLSTQQTQLDLETATAGTRSLVLQPATSATAVGGWGPVTLLAAIVGWVLLLLTAAAVGLTLTSRVLSDSRWNQATTDGRLGSAIRLRGRNDAQQRQTARRVSAAVAALGGGPVIEVRYLPERSERLQARTEFLIEALRQDGLEPEEIDPDIDLAAPDAPSTTPRLLAVDLGETRMDDARALAGDREDAQSRTIPVLV